MTRWCVGSILAVLTMFLAACGTPTPLSVGTGQLQSERSQVYFQKSAQQPEEVSENDFRTASVGDDVWTQKRGRAVLRFADLWVRIYDNTELHTDEVTPSHIKMTMGAGAALIGEVPKALESVIVAGSPPRARIVLAGTLVMIATIPSENVILVRTFDGKADVTALATGQTVQCGGDGVEWVLIGPDDLIETPSGEDVRALARRAGFWDQYHEIELDATGFGPVTARIPAERVRMTFVEAPTPTPTSSTPLPPTPTPAPTRTATPTPACRPGVLYCEDFEDGLAEGWSKPAWIVERDGSDHVFSGRGESEKWTGFAGAERWSEEFRIRFRFRILQGLLVLEYPLRNGSYHVAFTQTEVVLSKEIIGRELTDLDRTPLSLLLNSWYWAEIVRWRGHIQVYVDGKLKLDYTDESPLEYGTIAFYTVGGSSAQIDDIEVTDAGPEAPAPAPACRSGVLYCEDFEDGLAQGWKFDAGWKLVRDGANQVIGGKGHYWAALQGQSWEDYRVRFRLKLMQGAIHLVYRLTDLTDGPTRYFIGFDQDGLSLNWQRGQVFSKRSVAEIEAQHALNRWHDVEIAGWGGHIQVYVDGKLELDYTDSNPLLRGSFAFETLDNSSAQVDDIEVTDASPAPEPLPTPAISCQPDRVAIERGDCTVLSWVARNAKAVYLDGTGVAARGERRECPSETHTYELRATSAAGDQYCRMTVEIRTTSKPVISDIGTTGISGNEPICGFTKLQVTARVTSPYQLTKVEIWRSDAGWSDMTPQGGDIYASQPFKAGTDFRIRAQDEFGNETETSTLPTQCTKEQAAPTGELEEGIDRPGMDIWSFWLAEADPVRCRRACLENPKCQSFTYTEPGVDGEFAHCWIKDGVPDPVSNPNCTSGVRGSAGVQAPVVPVFEENFDRPGMDYRDFDTADVGSCWYECQQDVHCRAFTFQASVCESEKYYMEVCSLPHCWLKNGIPPKVPKEWDTSGAK